MQLTHDEQRALSFIAALLLLSAAARIMALPEPLPPPAGSGFDLDAHIAATGDAVAAEERRSRPLSAGERLDPNTAPASELDRLPGVGPSLAERIVAAREDVRFRTAADLLRVSGVGERTLERITPHLALPAATRRSGRTSVAGSGRGVAGRSGPGSGRIGPAGTEPAAGAVVDINRADAATLMTLRGVGEVLAGRIVAYRDSAGPFPAVDSLVGVPGIGPATLERLRARLRVR